MNTGNVKERARLRKRFLLLLLRMAAAAILILILLTKLYLIERVTGETDCGLSDGDVIIASRTEHDPQKGAVLCMEEDGKCSYIRVCARAGDRISAENGAIFVNGTPQGVTVTASEEELLPLKLGKGQVLSLAPLSVHDLSRCRGRVIGLMRLRGI